MLIYHKLIHFLLSVNILLNNICILFIYSSIHLSILPFIYLSFLSFYLSVFYLSLCCPLQSCKPIKAKKLLFMSELGRGNVNNPIIMYIDFSISISVYLSFNHSILNIYIYIYRSSYLSVYLSCL